MVMLSHGPKHIKRDVPNPYIVHVRNSKYTKTTNFSKEQWDEISDIHARDVWALQAEEDKLQLIVGAVEESIDDLRRRKQIRKRKPSERDIAQLAKKARGTGYQRRIAMSDSDV